MNVFVNDESQKGESRASSVTDYLRDSFCRFRLYWRVKERKKIFLPIVWYRKEIKHTISLSEYDGIRKMLNINYKDKVPSKAAVAEK